MTLTRSTAEVAASGSAGRPGTGRAVVFLVLVALAALVPLLGPSLALHGTGEAAAPGVGGIALLRGVLFAALCVPLGELSVDRLARRLPDTPVERPHSWAVFAAVAGFAAALGLASVVSTGNLVPRALADVDVGGLYRSWDGRLALLEVNAFLLAAVSARSRRPATQVWPLAAVAVAEALRAHPAPEHDALAGSALTQHRSPLNCGVTFSYDGRAHVLVGAYTGEGIVLRPTTDGRLEHVRDLRLHDNAVKGVAASGDMLFSVCADGSAAWHSATTLQTLKVLPNAHDRIANGCVGLGGGRFASVSRDLTLRVWEPDFTVTVLKTPHTHSIKCVSSDDTGRFVATGAYDGHVAVHDLRTGAWHTTRPTASGVSSLAYDAARRLFLASSYDGRVHEIAVEAAGEPR
ncbi:hypothetical protein ABZ646_35205 [Streptomyces sp. NPDC007162]|uniref:WD40 repeat domain-containing protein n=1 Tax=Streptomyces sp. NPDC007162 TaxID=3156917 RepID=UPI0033C8E786